MTEDTLRTLLDDLADDLTARDPGRESVAASVDRAWLDAQRTRSRRRLSAVAAVATASVAVVGVAVVAPPWEGEDGRRTPGDTSTTSPPPESPTTAGVGALRAGTHQGAPVWQAPPKSAEERLPPRTDTALPATISLAPSASDAAAINRATAVFAVVDGRGDLDRVVVLGADQASYDLDVTGNVGRLTDEGTNVIPALTHASLAPDGSRVFFVQRDGLEVYDFAARSWTSITTPTWLAEGARWEEGDATRLWVPDELGGTDGMLYDALSGSKVRRESHARYDVGPLEHYGPAKVSGARVAQGIFSAQSLGSSRASEGLRVGGVDGSSEAFLALGVDDGRHKACCPAVGWLDEGTVVLESRGVVPRVLAWEVRTPQLWLVSTLEGIEPGREGYVASWAW